MKSSFSLTFLVAILFLNVIFSSEHLLVEDDWRDIKVPASDGLVEADPMAFSRSLLSVGKSGAKAQESRVDEALDRMDVKIPASGGLVETDPMAFNRSLLDGGSVHIEKNIDRAPQKGMLDGHLYGPGDPLDVEGYIRREFR